MKNITLSAQDETIDKARQVAARQHRTLNDMFREWLTVIAGSDTTAQTTTDRLDTLWSRTGHMRVGKKLSRQQMNER